MRRREVVLTDEQFARLQEDARGEAFRDVLGTAWDLRTIASNPHEFVYWLEKRGMPAVVAAENRLLGRPDPSPLPRDRAVD